VAEGCPPRTNFLESKSGEVISSQHVLPERSDLTILDPSTEATGRQTVSKILDRTTNYTN